MANRSFSFEPRDPIEQTHPCVRCGDPVPLDVAMCELCNPLDLPQPASSQVHGTVFVAIIVAVVVLALAGRLALAGIGPFRVEIAGVEPASTGLTVTLSVRNEGTSAATTRCRLTDPSKRGGGPAAFVTTPRIEPGAEVTFSAEVAHFGRDPKPLDADCESP